ncbi:MAG: hypothetical protein QXV84_04195, partial [Conexivisphaerales archaeon]
MSKKRSGKIFALTFAVVFATLSGLTILLVFPSGPTIYHFPSTIPFNYQPWMNLIPSTAISTAVINVSAVVSLGIPGSNNSFLTIYQINESLTPHNVILLANYELPPSTPYANSTEIDIFQVTPTLYLKLQQEMNKTALIPKQPYHGVLIYSILNNVSKAGGLISG